ncbi:P-loop containing nucleoside triphosphate hydrolase protein [Epithele typhae]|uniref:P-loop containing nucleoside triphosphate hydrolase protein n=1 Tax=Epithele typhae TaxID=378194 RepID=UPI002008A9CD|nr:P-loop containing nucleoside triphosphate hydrolase protein [Epithele typhae]KAH9944195.1 P-loop containing nucleoside triphosphate hydrolase protein [Epithele typhae]
MPRRRVMNSESEESDFETWETPSALTAAYDQGEEPSSNTMSTIEEFESLAGKKLSEEDEKYVAWALVKWDGLGYEDVKVPKRKKRASMEKDGKKWLLSKKFTVDLPPDVGQSPGLKLMPFQVDGVNWLCHNWNIDQNCILADEMGLGKTVQIVTYLGYIISTFGASPALVVVPNSTLTNWVREFERWAPNLRVVPFYGEAKARDIIKRYELFHTKIAKDTTGAKYHVLVTTYETITNSREFSLFKTTPRWEMLVVDEGQRLKSDASLIFRRLKELNTFHRVIMTGTPLNNNIRELFNLMNFLDPDEWEDLEGLSKEYEELTDELVKQLHSQNLDILRKLAEGSSTQKNKAALTKTNMNNILMQLRKCLQHPYLVSETIEPRGLPPNETHERLFSIALDVVEDFLVGENIKYLRLDGSTKQLDRQKGMDEFNKPNSDILIYLLTTRAGGVGINLWSADTVIVFDPDFNPHQDLQAIARAHRYGQQKTVLVFKFMVKESAEERIMQTGKKKLILDHLIVQKMDDEEGSKEDVQSMLMFGAKALFEENAETVAREVHYSEHDIESLIEKTEKEGDQVEPESNAGSLFAFAKVWSADKEGVEDLADDVPENAEEADSWTKALELIAARRGAEKEQELTGRARSGLWGFSEKGQGEIQEEEEAKGKLGSDDSDFHAPASKSDSESDETTDVPMDVDDMLTCPNRQSLTGSLDDVCGLCAQRHAPGSCVMTEDPENLAQYRLMLMQHAGDETPEERRAAIRVIDETLYHLGKIKLIYGQPLHLVETPEAPVPPRPAKKPRTANTLARPAGQVQPPVPAANIANQTRPIVGPSRIQGVTPTAGPSTAAPYTADVRRSHPTTASARTPTHPLLPRGSTTQANASGAHHPSNPAAFPDPARKATVQRLKSILVDQQRRLLAASSAQGDLPLRPSIRVAIRDTHQTCSRVCSCRAANVID